MTATALTLNSGGRCIPEATLRAGDIIVTTGKGGLSGGIRLVTNSEISHAMLFVGGGEIIEAVRSGVRRQSLSVAIKDDTVAVAYRYPSLTASQQKEILKFAETQIGAEYDWPGMYSAGANHISSKFGGRGAAGKYFCSELVAEAYLKAGIQLSQLPSDSLSPERLVEAAQMGKLEYVGHLTPGSTGLDSRIPNLPIALLLPGLRAADDAADFIELGAGSAKLISGLRAYRRFDLLKGMPTLNKSQNLRGMVLSKNWALRFSIAKNLVKKAGAAGHLLTVFTTVLERREKYRQIATSNAHWTQRGSDIAAEVYTLSSRLAFGIIPVGAQVLSTSIQGYLGLAGALGWEGAVDASKSVRLVEVAFTDSFDQVTDGTFVRQKVNRLILGD